MDLNGNGLNARKKEIANETNTSNSASSIFSSILSESGKKLRSFMCHLRSIAI